MLDNSDKETRWMSYSGAIREGIDQAMEENSSLIVIGEGVPDPKSIFMTTAGLRDKYGDKRVYDMPLAENGMTGICIGAALDGIRVLLVHQRIDFSLLSLDQVINNAAKWYYMFNGQVSVPIVIRLIVGRGWGQGPQHSQSLQALYAQIPGLKVVMPATPTDAKGMLIAALKDDNPVIFIEHRWLHHIEDYVPEKFYSTSLDKAHVLREGNDSTVVGISLMVIELLKVANALSEIGIEIEVVDLRSVRPIDIDTIIESVSKTNNLIIADTASKTGGISGEIISQVVETNLDILKKSPLRISSPDHPVPTSHFMADEYYHDPDQIAEQIMDYLGYQDESGRKLVCEKLAITGPKDVPNRDFHGPF